VFLIDAKYRRENPPKTACPAIIFLAVRAYAPSACIDPPTRPTVRLSRSPPGSGDSLHLRRGGCFPTAPLLSAPLIVPIEKQTGKKTGANTGCEQCNFHLTPPPRNPGHRPGFLPNFLADRGVNVIISGGMGGGAVEIFNERNVEVVVGAKGDAKAAVEAYLQGSLKSTGSVCHEHQHHDECGE
jgi:predicted Fe-Mo cluster-binding NifX family protein